MNIQRLKYAWARGARLQVQIKPDFGRGSKWSREYACPRSVPDLNLYRYNWRIHPDDEHLQYGPVSTAFRDMALYTNSLDEYPPLVDMFMDMAGSSYSIGADYGSWEQEEYFLLTDFTRLFFAEMLADEGL